MSAMSPANPASGAPTDAGLLIQRGEILIYRVFDLADEIDLRKADELLRQRDRSERGTEGRRGGAVPPASDHRAARVGRDRGLRDLPAREGRWHHRGRRAPGEGRPRGPAARRNEGAALREGPREPHAEPL